MSSRNSVIIIIAFGLMLISAQFLYNFLQSSGGSVSENRVEEIVKNYILKNPQVIEQAFIIRRNAQFAERQKKQREAITKVSNRLFKAPHDYVAGNPNGDVTIVEFFDYNCGFCRRAFKDIATVIEKDKNVRVVFKELPIFGEQSIAAARAALASIKQNKYFEFHRDLLIEPGRADDVKAFKIAEKLGMNVEQLKKDMKDPSVEAALKANGQLAEELGVDGTPLYVVGNQIINGAPEDLADRILAIVKKIREDRKK